MALKVTPHLLEKDPSTMCFILEGRHDVKEDVYFTTPNEALDNLCPMGATLLRMPFFEGVQLFPSQSGDIMALTLKPGQIWGRLLSPGLTDSSLDKVIAKKIQNTLDGHAVIGNADNASNSLDPKTEMRRHLKANIPDVVTEHGGDIDIHDYDAKTRILTMVFRGKCASPTSCLGSQAVTEALVTNEMSMEFPHYIRNINVIKQP